MSHEVTFQMPVRCNCRYWCRRDPEQPEPGAQQMMSGVKKAVIIAACFGAQGVIWSAAGKLTELYTGRDILSLCSCDIPINFSPPCIWERYAPFGTGTLTSEDGDFVYVDTRIPDIYLQLPTTQTAVFKEET